ncbi:metallophosphoesterase family protein [Clostridium guangxiense]|uniref:metallophosphoesterase family protein n=1 Tax=Clostridium guangxiense TaxID=1662055 RepID=UPI001E45DF00|nr:metallophosphoesterase family protein [Clostridium guangxiense]
MKNNFFKKVISTILCVTLLLILVGYSNYFKKSALKFKADGTFKIIQFTDAHLNSKINNKTIKLMNDILDEEKPDLVVLTGDNIDGRYCNFSQAIKCISNISKPMEDRKIPWAVTLGNHDTEHDGIGRAEMMRIYSDYKYNVGKIGDYNISIKKSHGIGTAFNIYMMDSGSYSLGGYGYINQDQVNWYLKTALKLKIIHHNAPSIMFFHIPLQEYKNVSKASKVVGEYNEDECVQSANAGMFHALAKMKDVKGVFVGHDHNNDYISKLNGIILGYGRCTGYDAYSKKNYDRGARVFLINENNPSEFKTWIKLYKNIR